MNLCGETVQHSTLGKGRITDFSSGYVTVLFESDNSARKFVYPTAFGQYLEIENSALAQKVIEDKDWLSQEEAKKREDRKSQTQLTPGPTTRSWSHSYLKPSGATNIAFKCNYCDGGKHNGTVGFSGICSDEIINYNIKEAKHIWCCSSDSQCYRYFKREISRQELFDYYSAGNLVCYESQMLKLWRAYAGIIQNGPNKGKPMTLRNVKSNSLAMLTTRLPYAPDDDRFIFAVFLVHENYEGDNKEEGFVGANPKYRLQLSYNEARQVRFWDYYFNPNKPEKTFYGSGLHRYLTDEQAAQVLKKVCEVKKNAPDEATAQEFLESYCRIKDLDIEHIPLPNGALRRF